MSEPYDIIYFHDNFEIKVFLLNETHIDRVHALEVESYPDAWSRELFIPEINHPRGKFFVFIHSDEIIGYAGYWLGAQEAHITKFTVAPQFRRRGLGTFFMNYLINQAKKDQAKEIVLEVRANNLPARCLYEKMGFHTIGIRPKYYTRIQEDAILMKRPIQNESLSQEYQQ